MRCPSSSRGLTACCPGPLPLSPRSGDSLSTRPLKLMTPKIATMRSSYSSEPVTTFPFSRPNLCQFSFMRSNASFNAKVSESSCSHHVFRFWVMVGSGDGDLHGGAVPCTDTSPGLFLPARANRRSDSLPFVMYIGLKRSDVREEGKRHLADFLLTILTPRTSGVGRPERGFDCWTVAQGGES